MKINVTFEVASREELVEILRTGSEHSLLSYNVINFSINDEPTYKWISVKEKLPNLGQRIILFSNGVVQNELFTFDQADENDYEIVSFWERDDIDECPEIQDDDMWMPLPKK